jgi:geranylgeranyl diphosphate synthase type II
MNFESIQEVSISEYLEMIRLKTAVLIDVSLQIGAIIGEADPEDIQAISEFGLNLGIAFQLKDDFLDVYGEEESFGKQNGGDIVSCKKTFLYLKALELCDQEQRKKLQTLYLNPDIDPVKKFTEVKSIFDAIQIDTVVDEVMTAYYKKAMECLDKIKVNTDRKQILRGLAEQMYGRNY